MENKAENKIKKTYTITANVPLDILKMIDDEAEKATRTRTGQIVSILKEHYKK